MTSNANGLLCALAAYFLWGILPVYWKALQGVPAVEILCHRIVWSFGLLAALVLVLDGWTRLRLALRQPRNLRIYCLAALLLSVNWWTYIWAVNTGQIVETSLGYFINPLVSVGLGLIVLHERLSRLQWLAVAVAALGVAYLTLQHGSLPWVALVLAFSFGFYGLLKKQAPLAALPGLALETGALMLPALAYLIQAEVHGAGHWIESSWTTRSLLMGAGIITALPLLLFAAAARQINLSTLGMMQYLAPTCGLVLGIYVYGESFSRVRLIGFTIIWIALGISWLDLALKVRRRSEPVKPRVDADIETRRPN